MKPLVHQLGQTIEEMGGRTIFLDEMGELTIVNHKELIEPDNTENAGS
jgi:hypothetical protein